jgi:hypothetical protein
MPNEDAIFARYSVAKILPVIIILLLISSYIWIVPFTFDGGPAAYISARKDWIIFLIIAWIASFRVVFLAAITFNQIIFHNRAAIFIVNGTLVYANKRNWSLDISDVQAVEPTSLRLFGGLFKMINFKLGGGGQKYLITGSTKETREEIIRRINEYIRLAK